MITPKMKEAEYVNEIAEFVSLAIDDKETDGDRIVGYLISVLEKTELINTKRVSSFLTEARNNIKKGGN